MAEVTIEFNLVRRISNDDAWIKNNIKPTDLNLRAWDHNLVTFSFVRNGQTVGEFRLCWSMFLNFVDHLKDWFFEEDDCAMVPSCIDKSMSMRCMTDENLGVSVSMGENRPELGFVCDRSEFLRAIDAMALLLRALPQNGCYKLKDDFEENVSSVRTIN